MVSRRRDIAIISVRFDLMEMRVLASPGAIIRAFPKDTFIRPTDISGSASAVRNALHYAAKCGTLVKIRRGLYYKGPATRFGMVRPSPIKASKEIVGTRGVGPAGFTAARHLGLSTQLPKKVHYAVAGPRVPVGLDGVVYHKRNNMRRWELNETEIALMEVLRDPSVLVEAGWDELKVVFNRYRRTRELRVAELDKAVAAEQNLAVRTNYARLRSNQPMRSAA